MPQAEGQPFRLFRFVDTTVQMGRSYRYRVKLSVWNPNFGLEDRYISDRAIAAKDRLASPESQPSPAVRVPTTKAVLARALSKADLKKVKGMLEALVIGESGKTGNLALRSVITEVGGLVNVDSRLNKSSTDIRARGEDIQTNAIVVDVHGRQQDRDEERAGGRAPLPPEPFEILVMEPDGSFSVASMADSQEVIERNIATLPVIESPVKPAGPPGVGGQPASASPF